MKRVYDMSTGQMVEAASAVENTARLDMDARAWDLQLQLQTVTTESRPERGIPPELVLADPNAFIDEMS